MISRRRFLGYSALQTAAAMSLSSLSLNALAANPSKTAKAAPSLYGLGRVPIVLIGTGYGNAVTALRLAEQGHKVVMLEMGQFWDQRGADGNVFSQTMNADKRSMWNRTKTKPPVRYLTGIPTSNAIERYAGVLDLIEYSDAMQVYVGRGVGGGSLVNGAMAVTPPRSAFEEIFPNIKAEEMYSKYYPLANKKLGVNTLSAADIAKNGWFDQAPCYQFSRVGKKTAEASGYKTMFVPSTYDLNYLKKEQAGTVPASALNREVIYGNNLPKDAGLMEGKRSLDKTYLADALGTGNVDIYTLQQVYHIEQLSNGDYRLKIRGTDAHLNVISDITLDCGALFIGAGSCGTSELLVRARDKGTLPKLNAEVGQGWGNNGNVMAARANHAWDTTGTVQSTIPLMGINDWDNKTNPVFCEITPLPVGLIETWVSMYLAITKTPERSYFNYDPITDKVNLQWQANQNDYSRESIKTFLNKINQQHATVYRRDLFDNAHRTYKDQPFGDNFTYHPLGGCILGKATDNYGRVKGYSKLYVTDGSLIPGVVGVNPFVTITALAERNIAQVLGDFK